MSGGARRLGLSRARPQQSEHQRSRHGNVPTDAPDDSGEALKRDRSTSLYGFGELCQRTADELDRLDCLRMLFRTRAHLNPGQRDLQHLSKLVRVAWNGRCKGVNLGPLQGGMLHVDVVRRNGLVVTCRLPASALELSTCAHKLEHEGSTKPRQRRAPEGLFRSRSRLPTQRRAA